jgi:WD40 repeat protein
VRKSALMMGLVATMVVFPAAGQGDPPRLVVASGHSSAPWALAITSDGNRVASLAEDGNLRLWDVPRRRVTQQLRLASPVEPGEAQLKWSPDNQHLAVIADKVELFDFITGESLVLPASQKCSSVVFAPDGTWIAAITPSGDKRILRKWDLLGRAIDALDLGQQYFPSLAVSPNGSEIAMANQESLAVLDLNIRKFISRFDCPKGTQLDELRKKHPPSEESELFVPLGEMELQKKQIEFESVGLSYLNDKVLTWKPGQMFAYKQGTSEIQVEPRVYSINLNRQSIQLLRTELAVTDLFSTDNAWVSYPEKQEPFEKLKVTIKSAGLNETFGTFDSHGFDQAAWQETKGASEFGVNGRHLVRKAEGGLEVSLLGNSSEPIYLRASEQRKIGCVSWTSSNILLSGSPDTPLLTLWDLSRGHPKERFGKWLERKSSFDPNPLLELTKVRCIPRLSRDQSKVAIEAVGAFSNGGSQVKVWPVDDPQTGQGGDLKDPVMALSENFKIAVVIKQHQVKLKHGTTDRPKSLEFINWSSQKGAGPIVPPQIGHFSSCKLSEANGLAALVYVSLGNEDLLLPSGPIKIGYQVWDWRTKSPLRSGPLGATSCGFSPDGKYFGFTDPKGSAVVVESRKGTLIRKSTEQFLGFLDEVRVLTYADKVVNIRSLDTQKVVTVHASIRPETYVTDKGARHIALGDDKGNIVVADAMTGKCNRSFRVQADSDFDISPNGLVVAATDSGERINFYSVAGELLATAIELNQSKDWVVASPQGFFDASPTGMRDLEWRYGKDRYALEQFFVEFYQPGLLKDIIQQGRPIGDILKSRKDPRAEVNLAKKDRRLVELAFDGLSLPTEGKVVESRQLQLELKLAEAPADATHANPASIKDLRVFSNGVLAWRSVEGERIPPGPVKVTVPVVAGSNRVVAYAFNEDNVRSREIATEFEGAKALARKPTTWILSIGIDHYSKAEFDLEFATADAKEISSTLQASLLGADPGSIVQCQTLLDREATKENILKALESITQHSAPEDTVVVTYAGHGTNYKGQFLLLPHDLGPGENLEQLTEAGISDAKLAEVFLKLQARHITLVLDACHSGQALESEDWRVGPMNSHGLSQLAWEKGMDILTASQSQETAKEVSKYGHGLLTFALLQGFDRAPRSKGLLMARPWMDYAAGQVPSILTKDAEIITKTTELARGIKVLNGSSQPLLVQTPRVFHAHDEAPDWPVSRR